MKIPWPLNLFQSAASEVGSEAVDGAVLPQVARVAVEDHLRGGSRTMGLAAQGYLAHRNGVFVTIRTKQSRLRGCRGTIHPQQANLIEETRAVALSSAFQDERFERVQAEELPNLVFEVSVLHPAEPAASLKDLDPALYGIIVRAEDGRQALMLPGVEGLNTPRQQWEATCRKASIHPEEPVQIQRFRVDKFKEES